MRPSRRSPGLQCGESILHPSQLSGGSFSRWAGQGGGFDPTGYEITPAWVVPQMRLHAKISALSGGYMRPIAFSFGTRTTKQVSAWRQLPVSGR